MDLNQCNEVIDKNFEFAFIGDSFTEGTPIEYQDSFVGIFLKRQDIKLPTLE